MRNGYALAAGRVQPLLSDRYGNIKSQISRFVEGSYAVLQIAPNSKGKGFTAHFRSGSNIAREGAHRIRAHFDQWGSLRRYARGVGAECQAHAIQRHGR